MHLERTILSSFNMNYRILFVLYLILLSSSIDLASQSQGCYGIEPHYLFVLSVI